MLIFLKTSPGGTHVQAGLRLCSPGGQEQNVWNQITCVHIIFFIYQLCDLGYVTRPFCASLFSTFRNNNA